MSDGKRILRGTARAFVGLLIGLAAVAAVVVLGNAPLPTLQSTPPSVQADTTQNSTLRLVCSGSFSLLGADPQRPEAAIPVGEPSVVVAGDPVETTALARAEGDTGLPAVFAAPAGESLAAAQIQSVEAESGRGIAASSCSSPVNEQWLVGGNTTKGVTTTLSLSNPAEVPATAQITVYDENGRVAQGQSAAVRVAPGSEVTVSINGYAPDRERLAVQVSSTGAPVTASLGIAHVIGLDPFAVATVTRQTEAARTLVVPGVSNVNDQDRGPSDTGHDDDFKVLVRVLAPGDQNGSAQVTAIDAKGNRTDLGVIGIVSGTVTELMVPVWPEGANAVVIEADVPVVAGVLGSADDGEQHDYGWFAPAPELAAGQSAAAVVGGGRLVLANSGDAEVTVEITDGAKDGKPKDVRVPAGAAVVTAAPADALLSSSAPIHAGVRYLNGGNIDGYPILSESQREGVLTAYVR